MRLVAPFCSAATGGVHVLNYLNVLNGWNNWNSNAGSVRKIGVGRAVNSPAYRFEQQRNIPIHRGLISSYTAGLAALGQFNTA
jgi:hypothetical protein